MHVWVGLSSCIRIWGFRFLSESSENGIDTHSEYDFSRFGIQTLTMSHPCTCKHVKKKKFDLMSNL